MANHNTSRKRTTLYIGLAVIIIAFLILNFAGVLKKLGPAPTTGMLKIEVPSRDTVVYVDNQLVDTTGRDGETVTAKNLAPGNHTVVVSKQDYWPWAKVVPVVAGDEISLRPFSVPQKPKTVEIAQGDGEYGGAVEKLNAAKAPSRSAVLKSSDGRIAIWVEGDTVNAAWQGDNVEPFFCTVDTCGKERQIVKSTSTVKAVEFLDGRNDVLLFSAGDRVYAIEIDNKSTQNFQPVFQGTEPTFASAGDDAIYVRDGGKVYKVSL